MQNQKGMVPPMEPKMELTMDFRLRYPGYHGSPSWCRVRVWEAAGRTPVLIATELESNPGTSVTNRIEVIAEAIFRILERPERGVSVFEHYEERGWAGGRSRLPERFARVELDWTRGKGFVAPRWTHTTRAQIEALLGVPLEPTGPAARTGRG